MFEWVDYDEELAAAKRREQAAFSSGRLEVQRTLDRLVTDKFLFDLDHAFELIRATMVEKYTEEADRVINRVLSETQHHVKTTAKVTLETFQQPSFEESYVVSIRESIPPLQLAYNFTASPRHK